MSPPRMSPIGGPAHEKHALTFHPQNLTRMGSLQIVSIIISTVCVIICTVLAWITLNKTSRTEVSFTGTPTDKKEFDKYVAENKQAHEQLFAKIGGVERGLEQRMTARLDRSEAEALAMHRQMHGDLSKVSSDVAGLKSALEGNTALCVRLDGKIDRLMERPHAN